MASASLVSCKPIADIGGHSSQQQEVSLILCVVLPQLLCVLHQRAPLRLQLILGCIAVVFDGSDLVDVDESLPYTSKPMDYYTQTKVAGEKLVLAANNDKLAVVALRPSGIFGEGDTVMVPTLVRQAKAGKMKYIIGNGKNVWDFTYVGNVAQAHVLVSHCAGLVS